ncbi:hypothetical protein J622_01542 [Acinetobacter sp. 1564232]|nr:hypothetical protein J623_3768 [Acinetobacter sp. 1245249]EYT26815.1 hypothetical protein J622_01542 [Acinetobacter sp. 1564232]
MDGKLVLEALLIYKNKLKENFQNLLLFWYFLLHVSHF